CGRTRTKKNWWNFCGPSALTAFAQSVSPMQWGALRRHKQSQRTNRFSNSWPPLLGAQRLAPSIATIFSLNTKGLRIVNEAARLEGPGVTLREPAEWRVTVPHYAALMAGVLAAVKGGNPHAPPTQVLAREFW